ncbi:Uncharacterized protein PBTT_09678 [Plasmodiophora brassicae]
MPLRGAARCLPTILAIVAVINGAVSPSYEDPCVLQIPGHGPRKYRSLSMPCTASALLDIGSPVTTPRLSRKQDRQVHPVGVLTRPGVPAPPVVQPLPYHVMRRHSSFTGVVPNPPARAISPSLALRPRATSAGHVDPDAPPPFEFPPSSVATVMATGDDASSSSLPVAAVPMDAGAEPSARQKRLQDEGAVQQDESALQHDDMARVQALSPKQCHAATGVPSQPAADAQGATTATTTTSTATSMQQASRGRFATSLRSYALPLSVGLLVMGSGLLKKSTRTTQHSMAERVPPRKSFRSTGAGIVIGAAAALATTWIDRRRVPLPRYATSLFDDVVLHSRPPSVTLLPGLAGTTLIVVGTLLLASTLYFVADWVTSFPRLSSIPFEPTSTTFAAHLLR